MMIDVISETATADGQDGEVIDHGSPADWIVD